MDYHVMGGSKSGNVVTFHIAFHIPVSNTTNFVGVNYRTILSRYIDTVSIVPNITAEEQGQLDAGELYEDLVSLKTHVNGSGYGAEIEAWYTSRKAAIIDTFSKQYKYSGKEANVT
jgi:hypothetical protein